MNANEISLRLGVADLLGRYQKLADTGRVDELSLLFAPDAVYETNTGRHEGREAILEFFRGVGDSFVASGLLVARHHLSSVVVEPGEDGTASTYACFVWIGRRGPDHWGTYRDHAVELDGRWVFQRRRAIVEGYVPSSPVVGLLGLASEE